MSLQSNLKSVKESFNSDECFCSRNYVEAIPQVHHYIAYLYGGCGNMVACE